MEHFFARAGGILKIEWSTRLPFLFYHVASLLVQKAKRILVRAIGLEPMTSCKSSRRSSQLSYAREKERVFFSDS